MTGIWQSMNTAAYGVQAQRSTAWRPSAATSTSQPKRRRRPEATRWFTRLSSTDNAMCPRNRPGRPATCACVASFDLDQRRRVRIVSGSPGRARAHEARRR